MKLGGRAYAVVYVSGEMCGRVGSILRLRTGCAIYDTKSGARNVCTRKNNEQVKLHGPGQHLDVFEITVQPEPKIVFDAVLTQLKKGRHDG